MGANWHEIFDWLSEKLEPTGVALTASDTRVVAMLLQDREAAAARKMEEYEKALKQIRDAPRKRTTGERPCESCWELKETAREALSRGE